MLVRTARKRLSDGFRTRKATKRYVVTPAMSGSRMQLGQVLSKYPKVILLDRLDDSAALVEMSDRDRTRLARQHPELVIEPNIAYRKL